jgi:hypothetical protein
VGSYPALLGLARGLHGLGNRSDRKKGATRRTVWSCDLGLSRLVVAFVRIVTIKLDLDIGISAPKVKTA